MSEDFKRKPSAALMNFGAIKGQLSPRERLMFYAKGDITYHELSDIEKNKIEQAYWISEVLLQNRTERNKALTLIRDKYQFKTREETNRAIEDAEHYISTTFHINKKWQRSMTLHDIEFALKQTALDKDWKSHTRLLELKMELLNLNEIEEDEHENYFDKKVYILEFKPDLFSDKLNLPDDWQKKYINFVMEAKRKLGQITDAEVIDETT